MIRGLRIKQTFPFPTRHPSQCKAKYRYKQGLFSFNAPPRITLPSFRSLANTTEAAPPSYILDVHRWQVELLLQVLDGLTDYIFFKNDCSVYFDCNWAFAKLVGLKRPKQIAGKTDLNLPWQVPGDTAVIFRKHDQKVLAGKVLSDHL